MTSTSTKTRGGSSPTKDVLLEAVKTKSSHAGSTTQADCLRDDDTVKIQSDRGKKRPSIYEALGVTQDATDHEVRKAYFKMAIKVHPDRNPDDPQATERFQSLQKIYSVLTNPEKRRIYDQTGCLDDEDMLSEDRFESLYEYYKKQFKEVTVDAIEEFKASYQGSEEEMNDVLCYYEEFDGDMAVVFDHVMLSEPDVDSERFQAYIDDALKDGRLSNVYISYTRWKEKLRGKKRKRPGKALGRVASRSTGKAGKKKSSSNVADLTRAILQNKGKNQANGLHAFAEKWGCMFSEDPLASEEEFEKARAKLDAKKHPKK